MNSVMGRAVRPSPGEERKKEDAFLQEKTQVMSEDSHPVERTKQNGLWFTN